jgi:hypothetical protein
VTGILTQPRAFSALSLWTPSRTTIVFASTAIDFLTTPEFWTERITLLTRSGSGSSCVRRSATGTIASRTEINAFFRSLEAQVVF